MRLKFILFVCYLIYTSPGGFAQVITTYAGTGVTGCYGDGGPCQNAAFYDSEGICSDLQGNIYIADNNNNRIRKIDPSGIISTIAGGYNSGFSGDGGPASAAMLSSPTSLATDKKGNLYIIDYANYRIRKIDSTGTITTFAGNGLTNYHQNGIPATAEALHSPGGICTDRKGNIFFTEVYCGVVRKIDTAGIITTVAGIPICYSGAYSGDGGPATQAYLNFPTDVFVDDHSTIFIADMANNRIRKIDSAGIISTFAGTYSSGFSGDGGPATSAKLYFPYAITGDIHHSIYFSDSENYRIRKIDSSGIISTIAGNGVNGFSGDGGNALAASIGSDGSLTFDQHDDLLISDNNRIRKISGLASTDVQTLQKNKIKIFPNPNEGRFSLGTGRSCRVSISNTFGQLIFSCEVSGPLTTIDLSGISPGVYMVKLADNNSVDFGTVIIN